MLDRSYHVALSYASEDRHYVERVARCLRGMCIKTYYDKSDEAILGKKLKDYLGKIYGEKAALTVIFVSKDYVKSRWTRHELKFALEKANNGQLDSVLPIRLDDTQIKKLDKIGYRNIEEFKGPDDLADMICEIIPNKFKYTTNSSTKYAIHHSARLVENNKVDELDFAVEAMINIDSREFYTDEEKEKLSIGKKLVYKWLEINSDTYTLLYKKDTDEYVGYINVVPLRPEAYEMFVQDRIQDNEIKPDYLVPYKEGAHKLCFMSIAICETHRKGLLGMPGVLCDKLITGLVEKLERYAIEKNVLVTHIAAVGWTPKGKAMCDLLEMKTIGKDRFENPIYELDFQKPLTSKYAKEKFRNLLDIYKQKDLHGKYLIE